jgi:hypothetical protein
MRWVSEAQAKMQELRHERDLWNNPDFIKWRESIEAELAAINDAGIAIPIGDDGNSARSTFLRSLGLTSPQNAEESIRVYLSLKSVVTFWKRKLGQLKSQSDRYVELEKKVQDAGRANVDTARRSVVG